MHNVILLPIFHAFTTSIIVHIVLDHVSVYLIIWPNAQNISYPALQLEGWEMQCHHKIPISWMTARPFSADELWLASPYRALPPLSPLLLPILSSAPPPCTRPPHPLCPPALWLPLCGAVPLSDIPSPFLPGPTKAQVEGLCGLLQSGPVYTTQAKVG